MALFNGGKKAANAGTIYATVGANNAYGFLDEGQKDLASAYGEAQKVYQPYADIFSKGARTYADALGLNGAEGAQAAQGAFTSSPGYQFQMDQGLQALERRRAAQGMLGSGNTTADTLAFSQGLANQDYSNWLGALQPYNQLGLTTANQQAGLTSGIGDAAFANAVSKADISNSLGQFSGNLQTQGAAQDSAATQGLISGALSLGSKLLGFGMR